MATIGASQQGLARIRQARQETGWIRDDPRWLEEASKCLESNWQEDAPYAIGISYGTWTRFLRGIPINTPAFKAFCAVLNLDWEEIVDRDIVQNQKLISVALGGKHRMCRFSMDAPKRLLS